MKKPVQYLFAALTPLFLSSCLQNANNPEIVCDPVEPYGGFQIVDKTSGQNLFFSSSPRYQLTDISIFKISDKVYKDTIKPRVFGTDLDRVFLVPLNYARQRDTLVVKIADTPIDLLVYTVIRSNGICDRSQIGKLYFNDTEVLPDKYGFILKK